MATYTTTRKKIRSEVNSQVYTGPHNGLAGRDAANAHPMMSITGLEAELASIQSHIGDVDIHYAMDQISITESQISDLQAYLPEAGGAVDFLDVANDLTVNRDIRATRYINADGALRVWEGFSSPRSTTGVGWIYRRLADSGDLIAGNMIFQSSTLGLRGFEWYSGDSGPLLSMHLNRDRLRCHQDLQVDKDLTVGGDTILSTLAGGGTRTLKIDNNGKVFAE